jgi:zinc protease
MLVGAYGRALATSNGLAGVLDNLALYGIPLDEISRYTGQVEAVTPAEVQGFAARHFEPGNASVIVVGDSKAFIGPLKAARPNLQLIPASQLDLGSPTLTKTK